MNRDDFEKFVIQNYDASFDYPWKKSPKNEVFRHKNSKKWFALVMNVQKKWLGSDEEGVIDGGVSDEKLKSLVRMSYDLTSGK